MQLLVLCMMAGWSGWLLSNRRRNWIGRCLQDCQQFPAPSADLTQSAFIFLRNASPNQWEDPEFNKVETPILGSDTAMVCVDPPHSNSYHKGLSSVLLMGAATLKGTSKPEPSPNSIKYLEVQSSYKGSLYGIYYMVYMIWNRVYGI